MINDNNVLIMINIYDVLIMIKAYVYTPGPPTKSFPTKSP